MDIHSGFSFKFWIQYWSVEIKGENVEIDLQWAWATSDQVQLPALIGGNPLN
jgi:hypothetical protein